MSIKLYTRDRQLYTVLPDLTTGVPRQQETTPLRNLLQAYA